MYQSDKLEQYEKRQRLVNTLLVHAPENYLHGGMLYLFRTRFLHNHY